VGRVKRTNEFLCSTLQHTAIHCNTLRNVGLFCRSCHIYDRALLLVACFYTNVVMSHDEKRSARSSLLYKTRSGRGEMDTDIDIDTHIHIEPGTDKQTNTVEDREKR